MYNYSSVPFENPPHPSHGPSPVHHTAAGLYRSMTNPPSPEHRLNGVAPPFPMPPMPSSLIPGAQQRNPGLHPQRPRQNTVYSPPPGASPARIPGYPHNHFTHTNSFPQSTSVHYHAPPFRAQTTPPGHLNPSYGSLPPRLPIYPNHIPTAPPRTTEEEVPPQDEAASPEEDEMDRAITLSQTESMHERDLIDHEEEELNRALAESLKFANPTPGRSDVHQSPDLVAEASSGLSSPILNPISPPSPPKLHPIAPNRYLEQSLDRFMSASEREQILQDEALARKLAEEEEAEAAAHESEAELRKGAMSSPSDAQDQPDLPLYERSLRGTSPTSSLSRSVSNASSLSSNRSLSDSRSSTFHPSRRLQVETGGVRFSTSPNATTRALPMLGEQDESPLDEQTPTVPLAANQYIDPAYLWGVSIGFSPPKLSRNLEPLSGPFPNIISLPYGKSFPLHIQAPSWRQMLMLMAKLSGSRIEPTAEAVAVTQRELRLRTVVQFIRLHHSQTDWSVILWLTIDHPVPPGLPNEFKYKNGDTTVLPWTYTLSPVPVLLRDSTDTATSKVYTVPSTDSKPFPKLPITMPNMALYLQAALDESRRSINDSTSGVKRLAKMHDTCYYDPESADPSPEKKSMGGYFKRVIGRGPKNGTKIRGLNEDTCELVTPFVPEEWG